MKIEVESVQKVSNPKQKKQKNAKKEKRAIFTVPTSKKEKLVDMDVMRRHSFLSVTTPMLTKIFRIKKVDDKLHRYEAEREPHHVSAIMKLILTTMSTNELPDDWSMYLWNITQQADILPDDCMLTFTRTFERQDNKLFKKKAKRRKFLSIVSSDSGDNQKRQMVANNHDMELIDAIDTGDSVVSFGAEVIISAPTEQRLEQAVDAVKNYLKKVDTTRGLQYQLDVNKQDKPFITYGPNDAVGNKDVYFDMTSEDAGISALFVDSGGDRQIGSEYVGLSFGKHIQSRAAYKFINKQSLFIGNDKLNKTYTLGATYDEPSQIYLSKVASRAYLLNGHTVTHIVADDFASIKHLQDMPIYDSRKCVIDASKGLLNIIEAIDNGTFADGKNRERMIPRYNMHVNNIITLLSQFRDVDKITVTDNFANITREIFTDFFVANKYWTYDAKNNLDNLRLFGTHSQFKKLSDFGQYISQRKRSNTRQDLADALNELDMIVNRTILPTIPSLDTRTDDIVDKLVKSQYRIVDLTGMSAGVSGTASNPALNVMMISYLNLLLPALNHGDVICIHGISRMSSIAQVIKTMINTSGINVDILFTEKNQEYALEMLNSTADRIEEKNPKTGELQTVNKPLALDMTMIDLYNRDSEKLIDPFGMDKDYVKEMGKYKASFFIKTNNGVDYIKLDTIL